MKYFTFRLLSMRGTGSSYTFSPARHTCARGILTVKKTAVLNTPTDMLWAVMYYDDLGRSIKTYAQHYLGGTTSLSANNYDLINTTYNFTNAPTTVTRQHWNTTSTTYPLVTIANTYNYDQMGRKLKSWEQITNGNSAPTTKTLLSQTIYNEIGQIVTKKLHSTDSTNFYQNIAYTYNERGWLTTSSAPLFAMQLYYNTGTNKQYNGNIAYQYWGTPGTLNNNYTYTYDKLNRLTSGISADNYKETGITYDVMGNITALNRYQANTLIDQLSYTYANAGNPTNQLQSINDATTNSAGLKAGTSSFTYDGNGNLITDPTKGTSGISIAYNLLNLPQSITGSKTITYTYDASGNKLRRVSPVTNNTDYINGIEYDGTTTETLTFIQTEEGKAVPNGTGYDYQYYLGDNLGNTRNTFSTKTSVAVSTQQDDYYPFGMEISRNVLYPKNEYLYNKKELQEELGQYDYVKRFYDPLICRFTTVDPLATKYPWYTPYQFAGNEVPNAIDRDGMEPAYPHTDGNYTTARDGQLQRPLTDPEGAAYINSKTEIGGADHVWDAMTNGLNNTGTLLQVAGYGLALPTDGASLALVPIGESFDLAGTASSVTHDFSQGNNKSALTSIGTTIVFGAAGKKLESLEKVGKLTGVQKTLLSAMTTTASKVLDKGIEDKKSAEEKKPIAPTMQQDHTKTLPPPPPKKKDNSTN